MLQQLRNVYSISCLRKRPGVGRWGPSDTSQCLITLYYWRWSKKDDISFITSSDWIAGLWTQKAYYFLHLLSIIFPVHVMTFEKWAEELDRPTQGSEATMWVYSHEAISSSWGQWSISESCEERLPQPRQWGRAGLRPRAVAPRMTHSST